MPPVSDADFGWGQRPHAAPGPAAAYPVSGLVIATLDPGAPKATATHWSSEFWEPGHAKACGHWALGQTLLLVTPWKKTEE